MTWDNHFIKLKAIISMRKLEEGLRLKIPLEFIFSGSLLLSLFLFLFSFVATIYVPENYRLEFLGFAATIYLFGWIIAPLGGARLNDFFDFRSFFYFPISSRRLFVYSVTTSLMDASVLPTWSMVAGASLAVAYDLSWFWFWPVYLLIMLLIFFTIASSQVAMLLFYVFLRRSRWFSFVMTFLFPLIFFFVVIYAYSSLIFSLPLFDLFSKPELPFLQSTKFLPSSAIFLCIRNLLSGNSSSLASNFLIFFIYFIICIWTGAVLVRRLQCGDLPDFQTVLGQKYVGRILRVTAQKIALLFGSQKVIFYVALKELKVFFREPHVKIIVLLPLLSASLGWLIVSLVMELEQGMNFVVYAWPVFFYGALFVIAADFSSNIFGLEKEGIYLLFSLPLHNWQILLGKNLGLFFFISIFAGLFSLLAFVLGAHSWHTLHALYLYFVLGVFLLFIQGNTISLFFPLRIDSGAAAALQRDSFGRLLALAFLRLLFFLVSSIFTLPILAVCLSPLLGHELLYLRPFGLQGVAEKLQGLRLVADYLFTHYRFLLYAIGAYGLAIVAGAKLLKKRREIILIELCRKEG